MLIKPLLIMSLIAQLMQNSLMAQEFKPQRLLSADSLYKNALLTNAEQPYSLKGQTVFATHEEWRAFQLIQLNTIRDPKGNSYYVENEPTSPITLSKALTNCSDKNNNSLLCVAAELFMSEETAQLALYLAATTGLAPTYYSYFEDKAPVVFTTSQLWSLVDVSQFMPTHLTKKNPINVYLTGNTMMCYAQYCATHDSIVVNSQEASYDHASMLHELTHSLDKRKFLFGPGGSAAYRKQHHENLRAQNKGEITYYGRLNDFNEFYAEAGASYVYRPFALAILQPETLKDLNGLFENFPTGDRLLLSMEERANLYAWLNNTHDLQTSIGACLKSVGSIIANDQDPAYLSNPKFVTSPHTVVLMSGKKVLSKRSLENYSLLEILKRNNCIQDSGMPLSFKYEITAALIFRAATENINVKHINDKGLNIKKELQKCIDTQKCNEVQTALSESLQLVNSLNK